LTRVNHTGTQSCPPQSWIWCMYTNTLFASKKITVEGWGFPPRCGPWPPIFRFVPPSSTAVTVRPDTRVISITYCGRCSLPKLVYAPPSLIGPQMRGVQVRCPYPPLTTFPACPYCLDSLFCACVVYVSVLLTGWSCYWVIEGSTRMCIARSASRFTIVTCTSWRTPGYSGAFPTSVGGKIPWALRFSVVMETWLWQLVSPKMHANPQTL